ncbi:MAG: GUN4 domain-containing protein [Spirulina sp.]
MGKHALLIGVDTYGEGLQPLPAASKDVMALQAVLLNPQIGGFDEAKPLINPTQPDMAREIELWFQDRQPEDLVLLFFSGHGVKDDRRELYFAAANTEKQRNRLLTATAISARFIHNCIRDCKAKSQVLILDCCFSGAFGDAIARNDGDIPLEEQLGAEGRVVLASTSAVDYSFEEKGVDLSIYTRYLVEGLATGAADEEGNGWITVDALHSYAGRKVKETSPVMSPCLITLKDEGFRIPLARSPQDDPKLKYRKEAERRATGGEFTIPALRLLRNLRLELGLSTAEAEAIESEVLRPHRDYQRKRQEYQDTLRECLERESPLSQRTITDLIDYRVHLQLSPEDAAQIEQAALHGHTLEGYVTELERQRQIQAQQEAEAQRRQQQAEAERQQETERQRQAEAQRLLDRHVAELEHQRQIQAQQEAEAQRRQAEVELQQAEAESQRQAAAAQQKQREAEAVSQGKKTTPTPLSSTLTRQQFLKWGGLSGIGLIGAFGFNQAFNGLPSLTESSHSSANNNAFSQADYTRLESLLAAQQWKDADQETLNVMLGIANRQSEEWLDSASLQNFPCGELAKLNQLWINASDGRFGFSVQRKIYVDDCGGQPNGEDGENAWYCFADRVGWRVNETWLSRASLTYDSTAPLGHLPVIVWGSGAVEWSWRVPLLMQRLVHCDR